MNMRESSKAATRRFGQLDDQIAQGPARAAAAAARTASEDRRRDSSSRRRKSSSRLAREAAELRNDKTDRATLAATADRDGDAPDRRAGDPGRRRSERGRAAARDRRAIRWPTCGPCWSAASASSSRILERLDDRAGAPARSRRGAAAGARRAREDPPFHPRADAADRARHHGLGRSNPGPLADALFPVMGPAIRKAVAAALAGMVEALNRTLEHSLSWRSIAWRLEALRTGNRSAKSCCCTRSSTASSRCF